MSSPKRKMVEWMNERESHWTDISRDLWEHPEARDGGALLCSPFGG